MGLSITSIRKLLRQHCTGGQPLHLAGPTAEAEALRALKQRLAALPWARIGPCPYSHPGQCYIGLLQFDAEIQRT